MKAANLYRERQIVIASQIEQLRAALAKHAEGQAADQGNWGWAGDLGRTIQNLNDLLAQFEPEEP